MQTLTAKKTAAVGGFVVGVGLDWAVQVVSNIITKREDQSLIECFTDIDGMSLLKSGVSGAAGVGIINKVKKVSAIYNLGKVASATLEAGSQATAGAAIEVASEAISGESIDFGKVCKSARSVAVSSAAGNVAKSAMLNLPAGQCELKVAERQLNRAQRVARGDAPRISRLNAVDSAKQQVDNVGESSKRNVTNAAVLLLQFKNKIDEKKTK